MVVLVMVVQVIEFTLIQLNIFIVNILECYLLLIIILKL
jgi:hypothetical protein